MISVNSVKDKKLKGKEITKPWMNIPISFSAISSEDVSEEPLIVEAEVEGYLVRRVYVDEGSSVEMIGHIPRLVDSTFQCQIGRNLEAYMDDMVIKSKDEKMLLANIAETFDYLNRINMKLNPKKCSFRVGGKKFLGYMVTSEGIRANPKKTKALADLQSPRTLKEMQSFDGKLAALNCFLAKSAKRSLPFFNTLNNLTKENKHEYQTLNEAEMNYAPMEKLALSLLHTTRQLRRYFEAHPMKVITKQPIKNTLNNTKTSKNLAKYDVELGAYNITFLPHNAIKRQVLANFPSNAPEGEREDPKVSRAGLVLIGHSGIDYTYALRLTLPSTNNEAEYEALLAGLRIAWQMNISNIEVKVDFKLVASQINGSYEANKDSMITEKYNEEEILLNLDLLQDRIEAAAVRGARYKTKMRQYYNKKVRLSGFRPREFVF
uniref:Reverse transcriptase domain-containing protein n=1 Tax=Tanacetum cinerariifolium TaxID=118510 RepID=A0A6L2NL18_TANCI|nr:hypothetical protein [Tanacetum cinerariifolium]